MIRSGFYTKESGTGSRFRAFIYCSIATPFMWIEWWQTTGKYSANKTNVIQQKRKLLLLKYLRLLLLLREILSNISAIKISEVNFFFFVCFIALYWKGDRKYPRVQPIPLFIRVWFFFLFFFFCCLNYGNILAYKGILWTLDGATEA